MSIFWTLVAVCLFWFVIGTLTGYLLTGRRTEMKYQAHSETSKEAATVAISKVATNKDRVFQALSFRGEYGGTDEALQIQLGMNPSTQRPRRIELLEEGLIGDSGITRETISGRKAVVWRLVEFGVVPHLITETCLGVQKAPAVCKDRSTEARHVAVLADTLSYMADLNGSAWITGDGVGEVDMRQRAKALQSRLYQAVNG